MNEDVVTLLVRTDENAACVGEGDEWEHTIKCAVFASGVVEALKRRWGNRVLHEEPDISQSEAKAIAADTPSHVIVRLPEDIAHIERNGGDIPTMMRKVVARLIKSTVNISRMDIDDAISQQKKISTP